MNINYILNDIMNTNYRKMVKSLLAIGSDAKTVKGEKLGWKTAILYLVPAGQWWLDGDPPPPARQPRHRSG